MARESARSLRRGLAALAVLNGSIAAVNVVGTVVGFPLSPVFAAVFVPMTVGLLVARRSPPRTGAVIGAVSMMTAGLAISAVYPNLAVVVLSPIIAFSLVAPFVGARFHVPLLGVLLVGALAMVVIGRLVGHVPIPLSAEFAEACLIGASIAATGVMLLVQIVDRRNHARAARRVLAITEAAGDAILSVSIDGIIEGWNPAAERIFGYSAVEIVGRHVSVLFPDANAERDAMIRRHFAEGRGPIVIESRGIHRDGTLVELSATIAPLRLADPALAGGVSVIRDVSAERAVQHLLHALSRDRATIVDALGRLAVGGTIEETAGKICRVISSTPGFVDASIVILDESGVRILAAARHDQVIVSAAPGPDAARRVADAMGRGAVIVDLAADGLPTDGPGPDPVRRVACSALGGPSAEPLGLLLVGGDSTEADLEQRLQMIIELAIAADALLRPAVLVGREEADLARDIRARIDERAFRPVFQPIIDLATNRVVGFEALTRFADGANPQDVFGAASRVGLGPELEVACIEAALAEAAALPRSALLCLNVSPATILEATRLRAAISFVERAVILEITEHAAIDDYVAFRRAVVEVGPSVRLAIDDAGAGFASLRHILELRPAIVKLDRAIVADIDADPTRQALVAGIRHFTARAGMLLLAEGVETDAELRTIVELGLDYAQGYLFGRPARSVDLAAVAA